jgi:hypothetical protein
MCGHSDKQAALYFKIKQYTVMQQEYEGGRDFNTTATSP